MTELSPKSLYFFETINEACLSSISFKISNLRSLEFQIIITHKIFQFGPNLNTRRGRVGKQIAHTITPNITQGVYFIDMNPEPKITELARCITARQDAGISNRKGEHSGVLEKAEEGPRAVLTPDRETIRQQGRRMKDPEEPMFTLTTQDLHGIADNDKIRKLMPIECWRLQGFTDEQFNKARAAGLSDARLYKMAGNAVSVPVITALGEIIKRNYEKLEKEAVNAK